MSVDQHLALVGLGEALVSALLGLAAVSAQRMPKIKRDQFAEDLGSGRMQLQFSVCATASSCRIVGDAVDAAGGNSTPLLSIDFSPGAASEFLNASTSDAVDRLGVVYGALAETSFASQLPLAERKWLRDGIEQMVKKGGSLDSHLGLSGRGIAEISTKLDHVNRDAALVRALAAVADGEVTIWERCRRLEDLIAEFRRHDWPRAWGWERSPVDWPAWKTALFEAARAAPGSTARDPKLPASAKRLRQIAEAAEKLNGPYSFPGPGLRVLADQRKS